MQEFHSYQPILAHLLENPAHRVLDYLSRESAPRRLISLSGLPGAGKSTLAARLAEIVNAQAGNDAMIALGMDGFHLSKARLKQFPNPKAAFARRGAPWTFDATALAQRLQMLVENANCAPVFWPDFQHEIGDPIENVHRIAPKTKIVLIEGLYLLHQDDNWAEVTRLFDESWYLDTPFDVALQRLIKRHREAFGLTNQEAEQRVAANDTLNAEIVHESSTHADWRILHSET